MNWEVFWTVFLVIPAIVAVLVLAIHWLVEIDNAWLTALAAVLFMAALAGVISASAEPQTTTPQPEGQGDEGKRDA